MKVGIALALTGFLFAFLLLLIGSRLSLQVIYTAAGGLLGLFLLGVILMVRCKFNDPDEIHSFALTEKGDIYHITVAIPPHVIPMTSFFDPLGMSERMQKQTTFAEAACLACNRDFKQRVLNELLKEEADDKMSWMQSNNPFSASAEMHKMKEMSIEEVTVSGAVIRYRTEDHDIIRRAKLFRHNKGYKIVLNHIRNNV